MFVLLYPGIHLELQYLVLDFPYFWAQILFLCHINVLPFMLFNYTFFFTFYVIYVIYVNHQLHIYVYGSLH